ncbi:MAG: polysaccharide biosynthesis protein [Clostridia bacterium]|nr:polysaccharide biosynthesis protein [Clostridia bacterium]
MNKGLKIFLFIFLDLVVVGISWIVSILLLGYDLRLCILNNWYFFIGSVALTVLVHYLCGLYKLIWKFAGISEALKVVLSAVVFGVYAVVIGLISEEIAFEWAIVAPLIFFCLTGCVRFVYRIQAFFAEEKHRRIAEQKHFQRVLVIGAGGAGQAIIKDLKSAYGSQMEPVCALDDDVNKLNCRINDVPIVGNTDQVEEVCKKYDIDKIIIAIPSADKKTQRAIIEKCNRTGCKVLSLPGIYQLAEGQVTVKDVKEVSPIDLLGREQVKVNLDEIMRYIEDKVVLVTGGGGSIGSELCRQIAAHNPKRLIILDIYENNAYAIEQELIRKVPNLRLLTLIASVRDVGKVEDVFKKYKPQIVFHAAAHKHVPLMETSPCEAVKNNVCGTYNVADFAGKYGAEKYILISSDKAVNPTNVMGATKRICEMIIQTINKRYENTEYVAVRFGNVLDSNGSVIPLFKKQIEEGGPVTVTHKDIIRYFMTIPEAVSLVLQAGAYAKGGEIFVLDMGEPVKIYDLAINMIKLSGLEPFKDIDVKITGLRPGEKLYEEMLMEEEGMGKTDNDLIFIGRPLNIDENTLFSDIALLKEYAYKETDEMKQIIHKLVPTYKIDDRA